MASIAGKQPDTLGWATPATGLSALSRWGFIAGVALAVPAREWFALLDAPDKRLVEFAGAGHRATFDFPGRFAEVMREVRARVD